MNVVPVALVAGAGAWVTTGAPAGRDPGTLAVGIRPEAVRLASEGVPAAVAAAEYLGADTLVETRIGNQPFVVRLSGRADAEAGQTVNLQWDPAAAHWFDLSSERRIL
jgi:sn-glycerol 3-phosphate transport system ATP-binding protein